jgi:predicted pyridoxine 5'-phosphate oxidase superfamily flavin-nucleotide-binding protein
MAQQNPFHSGEVALQQRAGEAEVARRNGTAIASTILGGARPCLKQQPMVLLASRDEQEAMWSSLVFGRPGFLASEDGKRLEINLNQAQMDPQDPVWENIEHEGRLGSLVIEPATRRRIRINGRAYIEDARRLWIDVEESFPACPKYITTHRPVLMRTSAAPKACWIPSEKPQPCKAGPPIASTLRASVPNGR